MLHKARRIEALARKAAMLDTQGEAGGYPMVQRIGLATYQAVLDAPAEKVAELIDGELVLTPRPASPHGICASILGAAILDAFFVGRSGPGGWIIIDEPELHFDDRETILVPGIAGWRRERMPLRPTTAGIALPPDWICEVLSPSTERRDRYQKLPTYALQGVPWVWFIDPIAQVLEVHRLAPAGYVFLKPLIGNLRARVPPFEAIELDLSPLWGDLQPPATQPQASPSAVPK